MITSKAMAYGGYNYSFVNGDPPSKYHCHICTFIAHEPQQVTCCYNIYCKTCLETLQEKGQDSTVLKLETCKQYKCQNERTIRRVSIVKYILYFKHYGKQATTTQTLFILCIMTFLHKIIIHTQVRVP